MSEPTYPGDTPTGDWSRVYTGLDWVARWMADRDYTDAEIDYVVGPRAARSAPVPAFAPADVPVEITPAPVVVEPEQTTWVVPLTVVDGDPAETDADAPADLADAEDTEPAEQATA